MVGVLFITATLAGIISVISFGSTLAAPVDLSGIYTSRNRVLIGALFYFVLAASCASIRPGKLAISHAETCYVSAMPCPA